MAVTKRGGQICQVVPGLVKTEQMEPKKLIMQAPVFVYNVNLTFKTLKYLPANNTDCAPIHKNHIDLEKPTSPKQMP